MQGGTAERLTIYYYWILKRPRAVEGRDPAKDNPWVHGRSGVGGGRRQGSPAGGGEIKKEIYIYIYIYFFFFFVSAPPLFRSLPLRFLWSRKYIDKNDARYAQSHNGLINHCCVIFNLLKEQTGNRARHRQIGEAESVKKKLFSCFCCPPSPPLVVF